MPHALLTRVTNATRVLVAYTFLVVVILSFLYAVFFCGPGGSGVLASLRLKDGSEYMVTQRFNWNLEPYTVDFYMRPAGGQWGWCYIDHQARRWVNVSMTYDSGTDTISIREDGTIRAALDRERSVFCLVDGNVRVAAPQHYHPPEFAFPRGKQVDKTPGDS
jgi:hypothetical protein